MIGYMLPKIRTTFLFNEYSMRICCDNFSCSFNNNIYYKQTLINTFTACKSSLYISIPTWPVISLFASLHGANSLSLLSKFNPWASIGFIIGCLTSVNESITC